jgi:hypothetical protein
MFEKIWRYVTEYVLTFFQVKTPLIKDDIDIELSQFRE